MRKALRGRFWLETGLAIVAGILFVITIIVNLTARGIVQRSARKMRGA